MAVNLSPLGGAGWQFFDNNGIPLAGGLIYTYAAGTSTPVATYTTSAGTIANSNPIVLDSTGRLTNEMWITTGTSIKIIIQTAAAIQIGSYDNLSGINDFTSIYTALAASNGSSLIGYNEGATYAVTRTVQSKLQEFVSVKDFGAKGDGTTDDTSAIQNAINFGASNGIAVMIPNGIFKITSTLTIPAAATYSNFCLFGQTSTPLGTYGSTVALGSIIQTSTSSISAIQTQQLTSPNNTLGYWSSNIVIRNLQIWGKKNQSSSSWSGAEQSAIGLNLSYSYFVQVENVNVQGFGVGIQHINCAETYHTGVTAATNNYIGVWLQSLSGGDCQIWFKNLQIDNNANRDLYCRSIRSVWINGGECITSYIAGITNQSRIQLDYCSSDSNFVFQNFNAENHQNNLPLVTFTNSTVFASIKFINCCFESFNNSAVSGQYNPLVNTGGATFDVLQVTGCQFDRQNPSATPINPVVIINIVGTTNSQDGKLEVIMERNSPNFYDVAYVDYRTYTNNKTIILPLEYTNAIQSDNKIFYDPLYQTSVFQAIGNIQTSGSPTLDGPYRAWWSSTAASNYAIITPRSPIRSTVVVLYLCVDDNNGAVIPQIYAVGGLGASPNFQYNVSKVRTITIGSENYGCYMYTIFDYNLTTLTSNGITSIQISNIYGGAGLSGTGLESMALYVPQEYITSVHLTPAKITTAPSTGNYGQGEVLYYQTPTAGGGATPFIGAVNTVSTITGASPVFKNFGAISS